VKTVTLLRHQVAGYLHDFPFAEEPSAEQLKPIAELMARRHGTKHPKTGEPYWLRAETFSVLGATELPAVTMPGAGGANLAGLGSVGVQGEGTVTDP